MTLAPSPQISSPQSTTLIPRTDAMQPRFVVQKFSAKHHSSFTAAQMASAFCLSVGAMVFLSLLVRSGHCDVVRRLYSSEPRYILVDDESAELEIGPAE